MDAQGSAKIYNSLEIIKKIENNIIRQIANQCSINIENRKIQ